MNQKQKYSQMIKSEAKRLGFDACGIAKAEFLEEDARHLKYWLAHKMHGNMKYMENYFDKRIDPARLVEGTQSVISVILNYHTNKSQKDDTAPLIAKYAYGKDYHNIIKKKLNLLLEYINTEISDVSGRAFVDSAPVLERAWAAQSGLGWIGKNSNLISRKYGSFVFIGTLLADIELDYDKRVKDYCGECNKCVTACPTNAIISPKIIDARKCISYMTIEHKNPLPVKYKGKFNNYIFGCDICQNVCPWNRKAGNHTTRELEPLPGLMEMTKHEWYDLDETRYDAITRDSPMKRSGFSMIKRNIEFIKTL